MDVGLSDRVVVVTGAARGIGREICDGFAANGAQVIGVDVADMTATGERLAAGERWQSYALDLAAPESVRDGCRRIMADLSGGPRADQVLNHRGATWTYP